jgi:adenine-specific DNA methylase
MFSNSSISGKNLSNCFVISLLPVFLYSNNKFSKIFELAFSRKDYLFVVKYSNK